MEHSSSGGAWLVLLDDREGFLDRVVAVLATERDARQFVSEVAEQFEGRLEYGFYRFGWRFDTGSASYTAR